MNFSHVGICVSDMERSMRFYSEALGFEPGHSMDVGAPFHVLTEMPELKLRATFLTRDGMKIELLCHERPATVGLAERRPMNQLGLTHLAFVIDDIDLAADLIEKHGGRAHRQTRVDSPAGDMMFCTDPDGVRIELWRKPT